MLFKKRCRCAGLYIWGNVGRGKSMLMDLFLRKCASRKKTPRAFPRLHAGSPCAHPRAAPARQTDPVAVLAQQLAQETTLLCFDELQATDVADATLLYRLFSGLFDAGVIIVSTSNHPPAYALHRRRAARALRQIHRADRGAYAGDGAVQPGRLPPYADEKFAAGVFSSAGQSRRCVY